MKHKIVIGIDQSYADSGISIGLDGKIKTTTDCFTNDLKTNSEKRIALRLMLKERIIPNVLLKSKQLGDCKIVCIIERIRLQSQGFVNINYIKGIGALNALIVDVMKENNIQVYSVDTRAWKSAVVGTSKELGNKYGIDPKKWPTILCVIKNGHELKIKESVSNRKKKGVIEKNGERFTYNDNKADSIGICLYGFIQESKQLLEEEH